MGNPESLFLKGGAEAEAGAERTGASFSTVANSNDGDTEEDDDLAKEDDDDDLEKEMEQERKGGVWGVGDLLKLNDTTPVSIIAIHTAETIFSPEKYSIQFPFQMSLETTSENFFLVRILLLLPLCTLLKTKRF